MKILLVNDDGIDAPGLRALADALSAHELYVVAPSVQQSGAGHSMTIQKDLTAQKREYKGAVSAYALSGTPADCVYVGLGYLLPVKPDVVISGINWGDNMSSDCISSGTVGAALEGILHDIPSMAVSVTWPQNGQFRYPAEIAAKLLPYYLNDPHCAKYVFNLNVPSGDPAKIRGLKVTRFDGIRVYHFDYAIEKDGDTITFHMKPSYLNPPANKTMMHQEGTLENDVTADKNGYITVTPVTWDMVKKDSVPDLKYLEDLPL